MPFPRKLKILVAPLDWGLGHTTRCIPVIEQLLKNDAEVVIAGNKVQEKIVKAEFPGCTFLPLEGYGVAYSSTKKGFTFKMMQQLPHIAAVIKKENAWLQKLIAGQEIDGVISDNRFGLHHKGVPTVFITHQLHIKTGLGSFADNMALKFNYRYINKYSRVWIPDFEGVESLAGELSHPASLPVIPAAYIGPLSRVNNSSSINKQGAVVVILSGPEPQRSIFEKEVFKQLKTVNRPIVIIRGRPLQADLPAADNAAVYNHLPKSEMEAVMRSASVIVCRSGYSSVMDINALGQRSILIPTPGQTEQEYLADYLMQKGFAVCSKQNSFNLPNLLEAAEKFPYNGFIKPQPQLLFKAVATFLADCQINRALPLNN